MRKGRGVDVKVSAPAPDNGHLYKAAISSLQWGMQDPSIC